MNRYFFLLLLLILIQHDIILINEESLILFCTINFFWLVLEYFSSSIKFELDQQNLEIEKPIKNSLKQLILLLKNNLNIQNQFLILYKNITNLKSFCYTFTINVNLWLNAFVLTNVKLGFFKRLEFISNVENQVTKIILTLLLLRLKKISQISYFFTNKINNQHFLRIYKVNIREIINLLAK